MKNVITFQETPALYMSSCEEAVGPGFYQAATGYLPIPVILFSRGNTEVNSINSSCFMDLTYEWILCGGGGPSLPEYIQNKTWLSEKMEALLSAFPFCV